MGGSRVEGCIIEESTKQSACDCFCVSGGETVKLGPQLCVCVEGVE